MKKVLLASTALMLSAGVAAAAGHTSVSVGGDGRLGVIDNFGPAGLEFTSRIRISFSASGETEGGLGFGGSVRADNAVAGAAGTAGEVFITSGGLTLAMGDVDGAAKSAVGFVSGVGLTGLGDLNESTYIANGDDDPTALVTYAADMFTVYVSAGQRETADDEMAVGVSADLGVATVALGYEDDEAVADPHLIAGVSADLGVASVAAIFGTVDALGDQYAVSVDVPFDPVTATIFYTDDEELGGNEAYGIGFVYDLGGADLKAGYVQDETADDDAFDFGVAFDF